MESPIYREIAGHLRSAILLLALRNAENVEFPFDLFLRKFVVAKQNVIESLLTYVTDLGRTITAYSEYRSAIDIFCVETSNLLTEEQVNIELSLLYSSAQFKKHDFANLEAIKCDTHSLLVQEIERLVCVALWNRAYTMEANPSTLLAPPSRWHLEQIHSLLCKVAFDAFGCFTIHEFCEHCCSAWKTSASYQIAMANASPTIQSLLMTIASELELSLEDYQHKGR